MTAEINIIDLRLLLRSFSFFRWMRLMCPGCAVQPARKKISYYKVTDSYFSNLRIKKSQTSWKNYIRSFKLLLLFQKSLVLVKTHCNCILFKKKTQHKLNRWTNSSCRGIEVDIGSEGVCRYTAYRFLLFHEVCFLRKIATGMSL